MKLTVSSDKLSAALSAVLGIVRGKTTLPILSCVLVKAEAEGITLTTSNLDATVISKCEARVARQGAVCVPAKRLADAVRVAAADQIEIEVDDKNVAAMKSGSSAFKIRGMPAGEFPAAPKDKPGKQFFINGNELAAMLRRVQYAQCFHDASKYLLMGVFFRVESGKLTLVATSGHRLALTESPLTIDDSNCGEFILPMDSVPEAIKVAAGRDECRILYSDTRAEFYAGSLFVSTRLIDGDYPNYRQVIPNECKNVIPLNREGFIAALERASIAMDKIDRVRVSFSKNKLTITNVDKQVGESSDCLEVAYAGPDISIGLNPYFLIDFLKSMEDQEIPFGFNHEFEPVKMTTPKATSVVMPMRLT